MTTPQHLSDRYELGEILGFGGMSEVHLARDLRLHRDVAVKVLRADLARDPSFYLRFRREAQNAAALNHPAIVAVYDTGEAETATGPLPYIVMEYVDGITLRDIVNNDGPIPPRKAIEIIADACQALNFSHQHGIIHRDVKPANIMISRTGAVKVMDFGIARALADRSSVTQTAAVIGTAQYLSPEQARGESVDARSDVYSLGCVLYEILTGEPPFVGDSPVAVAYQHVREAPVPPSQKHENVTPDLDAVVLKALAKNPDNRYQSAAEMRADLVRVHNGEAPEAPKVLTDAERTSLLTPSSGRRYEEPPDGPTRRDAYGPGRQRGRESVRRWLFVVAALAVLTVVVAVLINFVPGWFGTTHKVQVPLVTKMSEDDAKVALQKAGFETRSERVPDSEVPIDHVVGTDPAAGASIDKGSVVTLNISTGAGEVRSVPQVSGLSFLEAQRRLTAAGFGNIKQVPTPSTLEQNDKVISTNPPAGQPTPVNFEIAVNVGTGPEDIAVPDVSGQAPDQAKATLTAAGFTNVIQVDIDNIKPAGSVVGTLPASGQPAKKNDLVQLQVSKGNQFVMPNLVGQFWSNAEPTLRALGWTGNLPANPPLVQNSGQPSASVVQQNPQAGTTVNKDATITLSFAA
ncbi:MAG: eukaryotic-like serine/threonine-protein kinase [Mycobacterium sp.]|jgi:serine/threonine-protein kinase|nr:eukaryotic-like serine/threonine-protein kinase [Mycobacterium sp.]